MCYQYPLRINICILLLRRLSCQCTPSTFYLIVELKSSPIANSNGRRIRGSPSSYRRRADLIREELDAAVARERCIIIAADTIT